MKTVHTNKTEYYFTKDEILQALVEKYKLVNIGNISLYVRHPTLIRGDNIAASIITSPINEKL